MPRVIAQMGGRGRRDMQNAVRWRPFIGANGSEDGEEIMVGVPLGASLERARQVERATIASWAGNARDGDQHAAQLGGEETRREKGSRGKRGEERRGEWRGGAGEERGDGRERQRTRHEGDEKRQTAVIKVWRGRREQFPSSPRFHGRSLSGLSGNGGQERVGLADRSFRNGARRCCIRQWQTAAPANRQWPELHGATRHKPSLFAGAASSQLDFAHLRRAR
jgi:hypothetical protein